MPLEGKSLLSSFRIGPLISFKASERILGASVGVGSMGPTTGRCIIDRHLIWLAVNLDYLFFSSAPSFAPFYSMSGLRKFKNSRFFYRCVCRPLSDGALTEFSLTRWADFLKMFYMKFNFNDGFELPLIGDRF